ncbi:MAG: adenylate/guanylate cyclase domain-containing protein [Desulfobacterales bacterium CG23_combo_of_CG06-09_8_20_14_all_52_9]|nr:MAG: adenylate/guanylate cyclase domain-containing protein [Desulfobacterales bacterium CG23_combo_of_CG06-09_8_20_14_all_52_9]
MKIRPAGKTMKKRKIENLAVLFSDIAQSTRIYDVLGNRDARALIGGCIARMADAARNIGGWVIKTIGDEIMCGFSNADQAAKAAIAMNRAVDSMREDDPWGKSVPNLHAGFHFGQVLREEEDLFGDAVNMAARMVGLAKQRQILTTEHTLKLLHPSLKNTARFIEKTTVKGKRGEIGIYEIVWERQCVTVMLENLPLERAGQGASLNLSVGNKCVVVDSINTAATMGRLSHNDLVINDGRVSRSHAKAEYRRGKFVLIDQSTNGTWVMRAGEKAKSLVKDAVTLSGEGWIGLGSAPNPDSPEAIHYVVRS